MGLNHFPHNWGLRKNVVQLFGMISHDIAIVPGPFKCQESEEGVKNQDQGVPFELYSTKVVSLKVNFDGFFAFSLYSHCDLSIYEFNCNILLFSSISLCNAC